MEYQVDALFIEFDETLRHHAFRKLRNTEDSEDAVMSVFAKVVQYQSTIQQVDDILPYLKKMVNNEVSAILKKRADDLEIPEVTISQPATPDDEVLIDEERAVIDRALDAVEPRHHREAATLYYRHELSYSTISGLLGISYQQTVSYIRQATAKVSCIIKNYYGNH